MRVLMMVAALSSFCIAASSAPAASDEEAAYFEEAMRFIEQGRLLEAYEHSVMLSIYGDRELGHLLLSEVAEAGYAEAQFWLASHLTTKSGGTVGTGADEWLRSAAQQGHAQAQMQLGQALILEGSDESHWIEGMMWLLVALEDQAEATEGAMKLAMDFLTDEQVLEAERRAQRCLSSNLSECGGR